MGFTRTAINVVGNQRQFDGILDCTNGVTAINVGLNNILGFSVVPKSCATLANVQQFSISGGEITPKSASSGDTFYLTVRGN